LIVNRDDYLRDGLAAFAARHLELLAEIRALNPDSTIIVGDIYRPAGTLSPAELAGLAAANAAICENCRCIGAILAPIHDAFRGHEADYLCMGIEPTLAGATAIATLFAKALRAHQLSETQKSV